MPVNNHTKSFISLYNNYYRCSIRDIFRLYRHEGAGESKQLIDAGWRHLETLTQLDGIVKDSDEVLEKIFISCTDMDCALYS